MIEEMSIDQALLLGFLLKVAAFLLVGVALNVANYIGLRMLKADKHQLMEIIASDPKAAAIYHGLRYFAFALVAAFIFG